MFLTAAEKKACSECLSCRSAPEVPLESAGADPDRPKKPSAAKLESEAVLLDAIIEFDGILSKHRVQHILRAQGLSPAPVCAFQSRALKEAVYDIV